MTKLVTNYDHQVRRTENNLNYIINQLEQSTFAKQRLRLHTFAIYLSVGLDCTRLDHLETQSAETFETEIYTKFIIAKGNLIKISQDIQPACQPACL